MAWTGDPVAGPCWVLVRDWLGWSLARETNGQLSRGRWPLTGDIRPARRSAHYILSRPGLRASALERLEGVR